MGLKPWRVNVMLRTDHRRQLDEIASRIYAATEHRPGTSEIVRAALDGVLAELASETAFRGLAARIGDSGPREAATEVEAWIRDHVVRKRRRKRGATSRR